MKWGETHHFRFNPHVTVNVPFRLAQSHWERWGLISRLQKKFMESYQVYWCGNFWVPRCSKDIEVWGFRYFGSPTKTRKNTHLKQQDSAGRYIFGCLGNCGMLHLTDLHFLSLECAPQEVGPIQTRRGCLVLFLRKILVGLKALTKNMALESEMTWNSQFLFVLPLKCGFGRRIPFHLRNLVTYEKNVLIEIGFEEFKDFCLPHFGYGFTWSKKSSQNAGKDVVNV